MNFRESPILLAKVQKFVSVRPALFSYLFNMLLVLKEKKSSV